MYGLHWMFRIQEFPKDISEDEIKELEDKTQKLTDKYISDVDKAVDKKTEEILTV